MLTKAMISVFFGMAAADIMWALYFLAVSKHKKLMAGLASGSIIWIGSTVTVEYVHDPSLRLAAALGAVVGTLSVLQFNEWKEKHVRKAPENVSQGLPSMTE